MPPSSWDDIFLHATPAQQEELRTLAHQQGLLYARQLPAPALNGNAGPADGGWQRLLRLLAGQVEDLEPLRAGPREFRDQALDSQQRDAVARALQTPDLFLIQGLPGSGKSRVVAEIIVQAAQQGQRVFLLGTTPAALDRILELVGDLDILCPIRCLDSGETPEQLPPASRASTFVERLRQLSEQPLQAAREELTQLQAQGRRCRERLAVLDRLHSLAAQLRANRERIAALEQTALSVADQVMREADEEANESSAWAVPVRTMRDGLREYRVALEAREQALRGRIDHCAQEQIALQTTIEKLRPLVEAKQRRRWWSAAWWRALFHGGVAGALATSEAHLQKLQSDQHGLEQEGEQIQQERQQAEDAFQTIRQQRIDDEIRQRRQQIEDEITARRTDAAALQSQWQSACRELDATDLPDAERIEAIEDLRRSWQYELQTCDGRTAFNENWIRCLEETAATMADRLAAYANVVAATPAALRADPHFGDTATPVPSFDLLILQGAEQVSRPEFLQLARRARRWVLVADADLADAGTAPVAGSKLLPAARKSSLSLAVFQVLWQALHADARRLPFVWFREKDRLCCRLKPLLPEQHGCLETEPVSDCPEIELRILTTPPTLAEIAFPRSYRIAQAKQYIFRELQELPIQVTGAQPRWLDEPERIVLQFTPDTADAGEQLELEAGVHEVFHATSAPAGESAITSRLVFERRAGWDRGRAEAWIERYLGLRDAGRTAHLDVPHRMTSALAAFVFDLAGAPPMPAESPNASTPSVEFVSSAPPRSAARPSRRPSSGPARVPAPPMGGAGLEVDLADRHQRERLPTELRAQLPERGLVNYPEARAIIQFLEQLAAEPSSPPAVAVITLYKAQAALLRRLVQASPVLQASSLRIVVDDPSAFREQEFPVVLVSLVRSHAHRAVAFGSGPRALLLALTRASRRLLLFGDPGTLERRRQWDGPLEHLDEAEAALERQLVDRLVHYLDGRGRIPHVFHLREGTTA
jgi:hypothetical protein